MKLFIYTVTAILSISNIAEAAPNGMKHSFQAMRAIIDFDFSEGRRQINLAERAVAPANSSTKRSVMFHLARAEQAVVQRHFFKRRFNGAVEQLGAAISLMADARVDRSSRLNGALVYARLSRLFAKATQVSPRFLLETRSSLRVAKRLLMNKRGDRDINFAIRSLERAIRATRALPSNQRTERIVRLTTRAIQSVRRSRSFRHQ